MAAVRKESIDVMDSLINSLLSSSSCSSSSSSLSFPPKNLQQYYQQGSLTLLNDLIAELEFSLSSSSIPLPSVPLLSPNSSSPPVIPKVPSQVPPREIKPKPVDSAVPALSHTINDLDIRVGLILNAQPHQSADKLYCEEIDVGEDAPRPIASGLVPYYRQEELQNRRVLVLCNLKPRSLVGFKSNGMVLCASTTDSEGQHRVEFIDPPPDAPIGSRIVGESLEVTEPMSVKQCDKLKIFQQIAPDLSVNDQGEVVWQGKRLITSQGQTCTAPTLRNCPVA
jgi:aminoacyl tRNA synthase complex-interacting multifunctional protein 1